MSHMLYTTFIGKDRDPPIRDPQIEGLLSLIKAILSLIDSYMSLSSLAKAIFQRVSRWGSLPFPMMYCRMPVLLRHIALSDSAESVACTTCI